MHSQAQRTDICQTCIHVSECVHYRNCQSQGKTILHCENFDDKPVLSVVESEIFDVGKNSSESSENGIVYVQGRMKGLCTNCEKRIECRYPVREGGVWHCEEYC